MTDYDFGPKNAEEKVIFDEEEARVDQEIAEYNRTLVGRIHVLLDKVAPNTFHTLSYWQRSCSRSVRFFFQRLSRGGWDDSATWSLDDHLAKLILPRLKRFKELNIHGWPGEGPDGTGPKTHEDWHAIVDEMIFAFEWHADDKRKYGHFDQAEYARVEEGMRLFAQYYGALWD